MSEPVHTSETPATGAPEPLHEPQSKLIIDGRPAATADQPPPAEPPVEPKPTETVDYWKQRARQNEAQAKANADAAKRLKEIEDRDLSELQKAQRDREEALGRLQAIEQEAVRNRVALAKQLDSRAASFLKGSTEEELIASADELIAWRGDVPPTTPRPDPGQGPRPTTPESEAEADYYRFFPDEAPRRA